MDWKETVMNDEQIQNTLLGFPGPYLGSSAEKWRIEYRTVAQTQAKISFEAGYKQAGIEMGSVAFAKGKKAGIGEVVEWCETHNLKLSTTMIPSGEPIDIGLKYSQEWQAFKKSKGIDQSGFTEEEIKDIRHNACDDTIG